MIYFQTKNPEKSLGSALGEGLAALAHGKAEQLMRRNEMQRTKSFLEGIGLDAGEAEKISQADPQLVQQYLKNRFGQSQITQNFGNPQQEVDYKDALQLASGRTPLQDSGPLQNLVQSQPSNQHPNFGQSDRKDAILKQLQASPYSKALGMVQQPSFGQQEPDALDQIRKYNTEDFAQKIQQQLNKSPNVAPRKEKSKQLTADDIKWENLTPKQAEHVQKILQTREESQRKQQAQIEKVNAPFEKVISERYFSAEDIRRPTIEALELLKNPELQLGAISSLVPNQTLNAPTQALVSRLADIVNKKSQKGKGNASKMRIAQERLAKADIGLKKEAIEYILNSTLEETNDDIIPYNLMNDLTELNDGNQPKNLRGETDKLTKIVREMPASSDFQDGVEVRPKGTSYVFKNVGGEWHYIGKKRKDEQ